MSKQTVIYKNSHIEISGEGEQTELRIDGKLINIHFDPATDKYVAFNYLAYSQFTTALDLARAIVDSSTGN